MYNILTFYARNWDLKRNKLITLLLAFAVLFNLAACGSQRLEQETAETVEATPDVPSYESGIGKAVISEVMPKNKATIRDEDGSFTDWIEIQNISGSELDLSLWQLDTGNDFISLDGIVLSDGEYRIVFASVKNKGTVCLIDANGDKADEFEIISDAADKSIIRDENGEFVKCIYPTPGLANTDENFDYLQSLNTASGPLEIAEVCVENFFYRPNYELEYMDYVELKNVSGQSQEFSGWYLTDDLDDPYKYEIPTDYISAGESVIIFCDDEECGKYEGTLYKIAPFSLDSSNEQIYLISPDGTLADYASLKGIPYGATYGRCDEESGFFYFLQGTPLEDNEETRARRICDEPEIVSGDGVFENVKSVSVEFKSDDKIYYTLDGSQPTENDTLYTGPITVKETCIVKAVAIKEGTLPSRTVNCSCIVNEGDTIPVVSVVADNVKQFDNLYENAQSTKGTEIPGSISYYDSEGSFSIGAGIKMHGFSTLNLPKKNMSFKFRGCYGKDELKYDIFEDGGVTKFKDLLLRAGGDQRETIVKNEVCLNLTSQFSDSVEVSRNKYVAVYVNGEYLGIYSLMEKNNENWIANKYDVKKSEVQLIEEPTYDGNPFREEVLALAYYENPNDPEVYAKICENLDLDSLIDWTLIEGVCGNWDLESGNLRYVKVGDGKWKLVLYDLDQAFLSADNCFAYVVGYYSMGTLNQQLLKNPDYKQKFLERASVVLKNELSMENVWSEYERLASIIDEEVRLQEEKNPNAISYESWQKNLEKQKKLLLEDYNWYAKCAKSISHFCSLTREEEIYWFGEI